MLLHIGNDQMVFLKDIEFILDYNECKKNSFEFLIELEKKSKVIHINSEEIKSAILLNKENKLYLYYSPISSKTLFKRSKLDLQSLQEEDLDLLKWDNNL